VFCAKCGEESENDSRYCVLCGAELKARKIKARPGNTPEQEPDFAYSESAALRKSHGRKRLLIFSAVALAAALIVAFFGKSIVNSATFYLAERKYEKGLELLEAESFQEAARELKSALELNGEIADTLLSKASAYYKLDEEQNAVILLLAGIEASKDDRKFGDKLSALIGEGDQAIALLEQAWIETGMESAEACYNELILLDTVGNTNGNINNGGFVAQQGDWLYYSNYADGGKLYKIRSDLSENTKLCDDKVSSINVAGNCVYYILEENNPNKGIYKIHTDGSEKTLLYKDRFIISMIVLNNKVYGWNLSRCLYQMDTYAKEIKNLYNGPYVMHGLSIVDDTTYIEETK